MPFDQILEAVEAGEWQGKPVQAGLMIHEGQLTYGDRGLRLAVDLGAWWHEQTGLPLPLGANAIRKDLGPDAIHEVNRLLKESIRYGLAHREERCNMRCNTAAIWTTPGPTGSSGCMSTIGRSISARGGAKRCGGCWPRDSRPAMIPQRVEPEFVS